MSPNNPTLHIKKLRREGKTLKEIGAMLNPPITGERVRQILSPPDTAYCKKHERLYHEHCRYCTIEQRYQEIIGKIILNNLEDECERLSIQGRKRDIVIQRKILIKVLRNELHMTFRQIGVLLKRDHSTIIALYNNA